MNDLQKIGGIAALVNALAYMIGLGVALTLLLPVLGSEPAEYVAFLADNKTLLDTWHLIIYIVAGVFMVPLVLALHDRLKTGSSAIMQIATAFGLIWAGLVIASGMLLINDSGIVVSLYQQDPAQAVTVWLALSAVENGLGGGIELPGGLWVLLLSWVALKNGGLSKALSLLGIVIGMAGILTVSPFLQELGTVFGLGFVVWFIWAGIIMLR
ncbi:MAG TPA: DUF4386 domain-containing protein [Anaerolineae bacterium]|nr:DUF4386 domain-containing protein [Anaerolineae bacterium]